MNLPGQQNPQALDPATQTQTQTQTQPTAQPAAFDVDAFIASNRTPAQAPASAQSPAPQAPTWQQTQAQAPAQTPTWQQAPAQTPTWQQAPAPQHAPVPSWAQAQQPQVPEHLFDPAALRQNNTFGLAPEQLTAYKDHLPVFQSIVESYLTGIEAPLRQRLRALETGLDNTATSNTAMFATYVTNSIPDLDQVRNHPQWAQYLNAQVPMAGVTYQEAIARAFNDRDVTTLKDIVGNFKAATGQGQQAPQAPQAPQGFGGWGTPPTSVPFNSGGSAQPATKSMLPISAHTAATQAYVRGHMAHSEWEAIDTRYTEANAQGLIDYNA